MLVVLGLSAGLADGSFAAPAATGSSTPQSQLYPDFTGLFETLSTNGPIDRHGTFFKSLGTNGRSCGSCRRLDDIACPLRQGPLPDRHRES
ncbi:MAG TPA: hypothetical protein VL994_05410, partial [Steroidobacteraceae bacterium]|nr:hypothetical protein [Steroidobacteraceae bacterium]